MEAQLKKVIVEVIKPKDLIADTDTVITAKGKVISIGPTCECDIKLEDVIMFSGFAGSRFKLDGSDTEYLVLNQDEVYLKL